MHVHKATEHLKLILRIKLRNICQGTLERQLTQAQERAPKQRKCTRVQIYLHLNSDEFSFHPTTFGR